jgi:hypothetical protein
VNATIDFLREQEVEIKVHSGDAPETVAAMAVMPASRSRACARAHRFQRTP